MKHGKVLLLIVALLILTSAVFAGPAAAVSRITNTFTASDQSVNTGQKVTFKTKTVYDWQHTTNPYTSDFYTELLGLALSGGSPTVGAATQDADAPVDSLAEVTPSQVGSPISQAEMSDLAFIAAQKGVTLDEAIARYAWNDNFALAVDRVRHAAPESFSGAAITGSAHAWVAYVGEEPAAARAELAEFARHFPDVTIEVRPNSGTSELAIQSAVERVHHAVRSHANVRHVTTSFDYAEFQIETTVVLWQQDPGVLGQLNDVARRALTVSGTTPGPVRAAVAESAGQVLGGEDTHQGGEILPACTSGFGTRASSSTSGTRGISTAGHCSNAQTDDGTTLTFKAEHVSTHGDFQWHTGPETMNDNFYAGSGTVTETDSRDVSGVGAPTVGQTLCMNGRTSHRDCQEVRKLNVCSGSICNLVQMGARHAAPGDSGGPVYSGNTAYGLHKGYMYDPWPFDRDLFSRADRIDNGLGIYIATN